MSGCKHCNDRGVLLVELRESGPMSMGSPCHLEHKP